MVNKKLLDEMVDKWWERMGEHEMTVKDLDQFDEDADLAGVPGIVLLDMIKEKYMEEE